MTNNWLVLRRGMVVACTLWMAACGGGDDSPPNPPPTPASENSVALQSDIGDYIGGGVSYRYTTADAVISVSASGGLIHLSVTGDQSWTADFQAPTGTNQLQAGAVYAGVQRYPFQDPAKGGLDWYGEGRGCNTLSGSFTIDGISYDAGALATLDLHFEQHCEGAAPALRGQIHWSAASAAKSPTPVLPLPSGLWQAPAGAMPASGNALYLQSDSGDYIGGGQTRLYTPNDSLFSVQSSGAHLTLGLSGDQNWSGDFQGMLGLAQLQPGYYGGLQRYPFNNPVKGGLSWSGEGRGCNRLTGWFVVDAVTYNGSQLASIDLRFEQHCEASTAALHGRLRWSAADNSLPPGPVLPAPSGLWSAPAASLPASGNYVYLQSDSGDYVGAGSSLLYTQANAMLTVAANGSHLGIGITGDQGWTGDFQTMRGVTTLKPGYYGGLQRYPFSNPVKGGLSWSGDGRGCNTLSGWFVVDQVSYANGVLSAIDLRFEQHCEGGAAALHGQVHWAAGDTTAPAGPVQPPPAGLWRPAAGAVPASGNYMFLQSDAGDYIGGGGTYTYTPADALLSVALNGGGHLTVGVTGDKGWTGDFQAMTGVSSLQTGYYGSLQRYPFQNPVRGGLNWSGDGRGCNTLQGWFVIDAITITAGQLAAVDLRFEQHCEGGGAALHGQLHWAAGNVVQPPGPVSPPPAGLWQAASTPTSGNYVVLQSDAGDYIGGGQNYSYTQANSQLVVNANGGHFSVSINGNQTWSGNFQAMQGISQLQTGYYGGLQRYPFNNPVKGGLDWSGQGRGCNTLTGWVVIDKVSYISGALTAIDLRFEQHCEGSAPALHGQVHWATGDPTMPPGPVNPPPAGLWQPAAGSTPAGVNYVYLLSDQGDFIMGGGSALYTAASWPITVGASGGHLSVQVGGTASWGGDFQTMNSINTLQPGYYGDLQRWPFQNPVFGGLNWSGQGRGCNTLAGWFVIDAVSYVGGTLTSIDLRFEQHCEGNAPALHGQVHWVAPAAALGLRTPLRRPAAARPQLGV